MVDYIASLKRPFLDFKKLIIGILLSIIPIISFIAKGYYLESSGITKTKVPLDELPKWTKFWSLFIKGLLSSIISIIYLIPSILLIVIGVLLMGASQFFNTINDIVSNSLMESSSNSAQLFETLLKENLNVLMPFLIKLAPFLIIAVLLAILAAYLIPIAILNYLSNNKFSKAFNFSIIFKKAFTSKYLGAWFLAIIISLIISSVLNIIPFVGGSIAFFITGVISYSIFGQVYKEVK